MNQTALSLNIGSSEHSSLLTPCSSRQAGGLENWALKILFVLLTSYFLFPLHSAYASTITRPLNDSGLAGYWSFDFATDGRTVYDRSGNGNNGTLTNATGSANWVDGAVGQGLVFDGSDDYIDLGNPSSLQITGQVTLSAWVNFASFPTNSNGCGNYCGVIVEKGYNGSNEGYLLRYLGGVSSKKIEVGSYNGMSHKTSWDVTFATSTWHHLVGEYDGSHWNLYIDGALVSQTTEGTGALSTTVSVGIGAAYITSSFTRFFPGKIDEVRIYNRALSADEVNRLYHMTGLKLGVTPDVINNGLVGHWTFDGPDMNWSSTTAEAQDTSGNGNNGDITNFGREGQISGELGQALNFDGSNDNVQINSVANAVGTGDVSISTWVKFTDAQSSTSPRAEFVRLGDTPSSNDINLEIGKWYNNTDDGKIRMWAYDGASKEAVSSQDSWEANRWHHIVGTLQDGVELRLYIDGSLADTGAFGTRGASEATHMMMSQSPISPGANFKGELDDVRVYNRVLSADEVKQLYNGTRPATPAKPALSDGLVGYWSFDFATDGRTVYDRSSNHYNGTLINATGTANWVNGKIGQGMTLDGSNDYINAGTKSVPTLSSPWTITGWINAATSTGNYPSSFGFTNPGDTTKRVGIGFDTTTANLKILTNGESPGSGSSVSHNAWHMFTMLYDGSKLYAYLDGKLDYSVTPTGSNWQSSTNTYIGWNGENTKWNGMVDEVRVYDRALSADEIERLYKAGQ